MLTSQVFTPFHFRPPNVLNSHFFTLPIPRFSSFKTSETSAESLGKSFGSLRLFLQPLQSLCSRQNFFEASPKIAEPPKHCFRGSADVFGLKTSVLTFRKRPHPVNMEVCDHEGIDKADRKVLNNRSILCSSPMHGRIFAITHRVPIGSMRSVRRVNIWW